MNETSNISNITSSYVTYSDSTRKVELKILESNMSDEDKIDAIRLIENRGNYPVYPSYPIIYSRDTEQAYRIGDNPSFSTSGSTVTNADMSNVTLTTSKEPSFSTSETVIGNNTVDK